MATLDNESRAASVQVPVCGVPVEILAHIFRLALPAFVHFDEFDPAWRFDGVDTRTALAVSQVCGQWRAIALSTPSLWTTIADTMSRAHITAFLARSRGLSLKLSVKERSIPLDVAELSGRIQEMHWDASPLNQPWLRGRFPPNRSLLLLPKPDLHRLSLSQLPSLSGFVHEENVICAGYLPQLRTLSLRDMTWLPRNAIPTLTHFSLYGMHISSDTIYLLLAGYPKLQHFALSSVSIEGTIHLDRTLSLQHLARLSFLHVQWSGVSTILSIISFGGQQIAITMDEVPIDWPPATDGSETCWDVQKHLAASLTTGFLNVCEREILTFTLTNDQGTIVRMVGQENLVDQKHPDVLAVFLWMPLMSVRRLVVLEGAFARISPPAMLWVVQAMPQLEELVFVLSDCGGTWSEPFLPISGTTEIRGLGHLRIVHSSGSFLSMDCFTPWTVSLRITTLTVESTTFPERTLRAMVEEAEMGPQVDVVECKTITVDEVTRIILPPVCEEAEARPDWIGVWR